MFGTLGGPELFLIFVVALIVFGPRKLPEIGKSLGKMMGEFRRASNDFRSTIESEVEAEKIRDSLRIEPPKVEPVSPARALPAETTSTGPEVPPAAEAGRDASPAAVEPVAEAVSREGSPSSTERQ
jgi:Tat protein translocase TatB subunit